MFETLEIVLGAVFIGLGLLVACFGAFLLVATRPLKKNRTPGIVFLSVGLFIAFAFATLFVLSHPGLVMSQ